MNAPPTADTKRRFPDWEARPVATSLLDTLSPFCEPGRIAIVGSLRRGKPYVGDIEVLYVPKFEDRPAKTELFNELCPKDRANLADEAIARLESAHYLARRSNVKGAQTFGPKNKLMLHCATGIPVDLFATTLANWWVSLVIRTGSKDMNIWLASSAQRLGRSLLAYGSGVRIAGGDIIAATSEQHVFELCGVRYVEPQWR